MPKTKISEYSSTAADNTDIDGINLAEGMLPSDVNNAIRELMAQLKEFQTGASGDGFTFAGGVLVSGVTNTISGNVVMSGNLNSSGTNTFSGSQVFSGVTNIGYGLFTKSDPTIVAWTKTGAFTVSTATTLYIEVNGIIKTIAASTAVTMPGSATIGTDYAIWAKTDGTLEATANHTSPPTANARRVGGFHYAPGGNATGTSGGDTTPAINAYSFWDLKFRPRCPDPRGMTLVAGNFWSDIYLCGVDHYTNGTSKYNVTIADGSSLPKISAAFGGNGTATYAGGTWYSFNEIMIGVGKKLPTYTEFCALAYGTTEESSAGTDPGSTILREAYTSKWGVIQSTGVLWVWCRDFIASGAGIGGWQDITGDRGNVYTYDASARAGILGGAWGAGSNAGSRCSDWGVDPSVSAYSIGARGVCDHLQLD